MVPGPTVNRGWQERGDDFSLSFLVLVQKALEAVENGTAQHERLPLVHHGHQQHYDGRPWWIRRCIYRGKVVLICLASSDDL